MQLKAVSVDHRVQVLRQKEGTWGRISVRLSSMHLRIFSSSCSSLEIKLALQFPWAHQTESLQVSDDAAAEGSEVSSVLCLRVRVHGWVSAGGRECGFGGVSCSPPFDLLIIMFPWHQSKECIMTGVNVRDDCPGFLHLKKKNFFRVSVWAEKWLSLLLFCLTYY